jgi:hypothetical protein
MLSNIQINFHIEILPKFHYSLATGEILSSGLRTLQISKRNLLDICQITHLIFGKIFGKLGKEK